MGVKEVPREQVWQSDQHVHTLKTRGVALSVWKVSRVGGRRLAQVRVACLKLVEKMLLKVPGLN